MKYIGFGGFGHQVRDCLHPRDLAALLEKQMATRTPPRGVRLINVSGGAVSARSLRQLSDWCASRFGPHSIGVDSTPRPFDLPWVVLDSGRAQQLWDWRPKIPVAAILDEIARHAEANPDWLNLSAPL